MFIRLHFPHAKKCVLNKKIFFTQNSPSLKTFSINSDKDNAMITITDKRHNTRSVFSNTVRRWHHDDFLRKFEERKNGLGDECEKRVDFCITFNSKRFKIQRSMIIKKKYLFFFSNVYQPIDWNIKKKIWLFVQFDRCRALIFSFDRSG